MNKSEVVFSVGVWLPGAGMGNHAYYLTQGLYRYDLLERAFVMRDAGIGLPSEKIKECYITEKVAYRLARYTRLDQYVLRDNLFDFWVARRLERADLFYGWTHHALWSLKRAKRLGMKTVLERANAHPDTYCRIMKPEYQKWGIRATPYHPWIYKKHCRELRETDYIAVTSQFTRHSLHEHGIDDKRILLTPLGVDTEYYAPHPKEHNKGSQQDDIFRVVYVGQICIRKGIPYLLEAWNKLQLQQAELILVGDVWEEMQELLHHHLHRNRTIKTFPHVDSPVSLYQQASVCILPTLEDGFGLVVLEAMACGVPIILTEHTGAKDCVRPNTDGFLIPPANSDAIAETLSYCYHHRAQLQTMGKHAREQAKRFSWDRYQDGIAEHIKRIIG